MTEGLNCCFAQLSSSTLYESLSFLVVRFSMDILKYILHIYGVRRKPSFFIFVEQHPNIYYRTFILNDQGHLWTTSPLGRRCKHSNVVGIGKPSECAPKGAAMATLALCSFAKLLLCCNPKAPNSSKSAPSVASFREPPDPEVERY